MMSLCAVMATSPMRESIIVQLQSDTDHDALDLKNISDELLQVYARANRIVSDRISHELSRREAIKTPAAGLGRPLPKIPGIKPVIAAGKIEETPATGHMKKGTPPHAPGKMKAKEKLVVPVKGEGPVASGQQKAEIKMLIAEEHDTKEMLNEKLHYYKEVLTKSDMEDFKVAIRVQAIINALYKISPEDAKNWVHHFKNEKDIILKLPVTMSKEIVKEAPKAEGFATSVAEAIAKRRKGVEPEKEEEENEEWD